MDRASGEAPVLDRATIVGGCFGEAIKIYVVALSQALVAHKRSSLLKRQQLNYPQWQWL